jgi:fumarate hydratase subunit alpha
MLYIDVIDGDTITLTVAPKGFGSENMSQVKMLRPSDGEQGLIDFVIGAVEAAGPNPCPPIVAGIGLGGTFDKAALLAKKSLLRPLDLPHPDPYYAGLEREILSRINALGIGPQGFGGGTTALAAAIEVMPTHIAGLPAAVNINCHVCRHVREII